ncbi:hypothetical protein SAMN05192588_1364 [Nonlabens sp. Hel1_33_55]|uniref:hypothetical protein n=1 Tax=Nonlabens sp. Hel1_33_55 TaxID=1336802 RepID=UPI000875BA17|nr:hypothetical protein [Nonlabens sp. Hel1_33_55]SCY14416.1 hypothetical protein SAMN05192588_1364 [Nonlabens sp. Hel1_33_55]
MKWRIGVLFLLLFAFAKAQNLQDLVPEIEQRPRQITDTLGRDYDDRTLEVRELPADLSEQYSGDEFDYEETTQEADNFITDFFDWLFGALGRWFGIEISPLWAEIIKWTVYALFGAIAIYFLVRLLTGEKASGITARGGDNKNQIKVEETHIQELDLNKFINEAIANGNYRNAVRYLYLNSLKMLSSAGKIDWDFQKTNSDYYREIKDVDLKTQFQKVSYLYDYVWYGEFAIDESAFAKAKQQFELLNKKAA